MSIKIWRKNESKWRCLEGQWGVRWARKKEGLMVNWSLNIMKINKNTNHECQLTDHWYSSIFGKHKIQRFFCEVGIF